MKAAVLVYGAYGYTARLVAQLAASKGIPLLLAGRDAGKTAAVAGEFGHEYRAFGLEDPDSLRAGLAGVEAVLHCAGPFSQTSAPMVDACLEVGVPYLDVTGEISVFEALAARDAEARARGVALLPGVGFDVVPSDCLAAHLHRRLPGASALTLAFHGVGGGMSHGTAKTSVEGLGLGGKIRRAGAIVTVPHGYKTRVVPFPSGPRDAMTLPWGDVSTAFHSTGIPDIEVYVAAPRAGARLIRLTGAMQPLLASRAVQGILGALVDARVRGPSDAARASGRSEVWGEARDTSGQSVRASLVAPEGYSLTAATALDAALRAARGELRPGFLTPSLAFGADYILGFEGTQRADLP